MFITIIIICIIAYFLFLKPFLKNREEQNIISYLSVPHEVKCLIEIEAVFELADILVELELRKEYALAKLVLEAIDSKGFSFANRVDTIRNEKRIQVGLGPLK